MNVTPATGTNPASPASIDSLANTAKPTAMAVAPPITATMLPVAPARGRGLPCARTSLRMTICSTGRRNTVNPRKSTVHMTDTGANASAPRARPPMTWKRYAPTALTIVPRNIIVVPARRGEGDRVPRVLIIDDDTGPAVAAPLTVPAPRLARDERWSHRSAPATSHRSETQTGTPGRGW